MRRKALNTVAILTVGIATFGVLPSYSVNAAPLDTLQSAIDNTLDKAQEQGWDVIAKAKSSKSHTMVGTAISLPAGVNIRHHVESDGSGKSYYSVRRDSTKSLLGMKGISYSTSESASTPIPFASLSMLSIGMAPNWPQQFADSREFPLNTVISELSGRMGYYEPSSFSSESAGRSLVMPALSWTSARDFWRNVREKRVSGGRTVITARSTGGEDSDCRYPSIAITIKNGYIVNSAWTSVCPESGTTKYVVKVKFDKQVGSVPDTAITEDQAFATPASNQNRLWPILAAAANATANEQQVSISETNSAGVTFEDLDTSRALRYLDQVMMAGNPGTVITLSSNGAADPNQRTYVVTPNGAAGVLAEGYQVDIIEIRVTVSGSGLIDRIVTRFDKEPIESIIDFRRP